MRWGREDPRRSLNIIAPVHRVKVLLGVDGDRLDVHLSRRGSGALGLPGRRLRGAGVGRALRRRLALAEQQRASVAARKMRMAISPLLAAITCAETSTSEWRLADHPKLDPSHFFDGPPPRSRWRWRRHRAGRRPAAGQRRRNRPMPRQRRRCDACAARTKGAQHGTGLEAGAACASVWGAINWSAVWPSSVLLLFFVMPG